MQHKTTHENNTRDNRHAGAIGQLQRLDDLDDFEIADGDPDIDGWKVKTSDGREAGKIDGLIVDTNAMQVRYLDVELDRKALGLSDDRHVLVPISAARLDDDKDLVLLGSLSVAQLAMLQRYQPGMAVAPGSDRDIEKSDPTRFYGKRGGTGNVKRMTLSEEELKVGKRQTSTGEVDVHKTVETRHVSRKVPVSHEEVSVERRPLSADSDRAGKISDDEVRIPLSAEEAVVEKRTVPREEVVITKRTVQGEQKVDADLKHEKVDVDRKKRRS